MVPNQLPFIQTQIQPEGHSPAACKVICMSWLSKKIESVLRIFKNNKNTTSPSMGYRSRLFEQDYISLYI